MAMSLESKTFHQAFYCFRCRGMNRLHCFDCVCCGVSRRAYAATTVCSPSQLARTFSRRTAAFTAKVFLARASCFFRHTYMILCIVCPLVPSTADYLKRCTACAGCGHPIVQGVLVQTVVSGHCGLKLFLRLWLILQAAAFA